MHIIDTMILSAMKASFEGLTTIKDQCEILDMFYSMSERSRWKMISLQVTHIYYFPTHKEIEFAELTFLL
jgi:hypothetical protein